MAIRKPMGKSTDSWGADFDREMRAINEKWAKMTPAEKKSMRNAWDRDLLERIKTVPKKVVQAKVKVNKNAPKPAAPKTGNVTVIPKGSKPKTKTNSQKAAEAAKRGASQKGGRSSRGGGRPMGGGLIGGGGFRGPVIK